MDIKRKFIKLTKKTYPFGTERELVSHLPKGFFKDPHGNYYFKIGKSRTAFTCHLDTACRDQVLVNHKVNKNIISTDGKSILGADDKAGMTILLYMIEKKVSGLYCFFIGEEVGCIGSGKACLDKMFLDYDRMISFDRRGTKSIITYQSSRRCCSDEFASELAIRLNSCGMSFEKDDTGVYTDSAEFTDVIPECTNISVGYYREHTTYEHQDIDHLIKLCISVTKVDWESLPTVRDKNKIEYKSYSYKNYNYPNYGKYENNFDKKPKTNTACRKNKRSYIDSHYDDLDNFYGYDPLSTSYDKNKMGKIYIEDLDKDFSEEYYSRNYFDTKSETFYYESFKQKMYDDHMSNSDKFKIKEQIFDLNDDYDDEFRDYFMMYGGIPS